MANKPKKASLWAGKVVAWLYIYNITQRELAAKIGWTPRYLNMVLRGYRTPKGAQDKIDTALHRLIIDKMGTDDAWRAW